MDRTYFTVRVIGTKRPKRAVFYMTSFGFPWWVYIIPILRLRLKGLAVIVYDFDNVVLDNNDPHILIESTHLVHSDMNRRRREFELSGVKILGGIGNSLGSYMLYSYCLTNPLDHAVLNGGGSLADLIFEPVDTRFKKIGESYVANGYSRECTEKLWASYFDLRRAEAIQARAILFTISSRDGVMPYESTKKFLEAFKRSEADLTVQVDVRSHTKSIMYNAHNVAKIYSFLDS